MSRVKVFRNIYWVIASLILIVPAVAMQFTHEVNWGPYDFLIMGALLLATGIAIEVAVRMTAKTRNRVALIAAILMAFLFIWAELAVGIL